ncbi:Chromobox protein 1 [Rhodotorula toruloides]
MSVDPRLLMNAGCGEEEDEGPAEETYTVERIVDYKVCDLINLGTPLEEWEDPKTRYEVRYLVKWQGYDDPAANTWEPRRNFASWQDAYNDQIARIKGKHWKKRSIEELEKEAARKNEAWNEERARENKKQVKKLMKGGVLQGEKKGKKAVKQEKVKAETVKPDKGKGKGKEPLRRIGRERASASPALSATGFNKAPTRRTRTSRVSDAYIDQEALNEFIESGNAPADLRALRATPPPKHDAEGNLILSSSEAGSPASHRPSSPARTAANGAQFGFAGSVDEDEEDVSMANRSGQADVAQAQPTEGAAAGGQSGFAGSGSEDEMDVDMAGQRPQVHYGFAGDSDEELDTMQAERHPLPAAAAAAPGPVAGGFAGDDEEEEDDDTGYFPALTPFPSSFSREPTSQPAPSTQKGGFAGSSDDEDSGDDSGYIERSRDDAAHRADPAMPVGAAALRSNSVEQQGFAGSDIDQKPAACAQEAGLARPAGGFAGESDEGEPAEPAHDREVRGQGFAGEIGEGEEPAVDESHEGGFAGDLEEEEDVKPMLQTLVEQPPPTEAAVPAASTSAPSAGGAGGFAGSDEESEEPPPPATAAPTETQPQPVAAAPVQQPAEASLAPARSTEAPLASTSNGAAPPQPVAAVLPSSSRSPSSVKGPTASEQMSPSPVPRGPKIPHKRPSCDEDFPSAGTSSKPPPAKKVKSSDGGRASSEGSADSRAKKMDGKKKASVESPDDKRPAKKKKKRRVVDDHEEEEQQPGSKAPLTQAQQIARMKIRKVDPSVPKASPQAASPVEQERQSPSVSADSSSLTGSSSAQAKQAKKAQDPFNYGVAQVRSTNGFVAINRDKLGMRKLGQKLRAAYNVTLPPQLVGDVDQIRFMWSVGSSHGDPLHGADDFDDIMHNEGRLLEVFITQPPDESQAGVDKRAKRHNDEYLALQLVLSSFQNVKQADAPRDSVAACFVHVSELPKLGRFPGKYAGMNRLRDHPGIVFFVYGMDEQRRRRAMRQIWRPLLAVTFTPSALTRDAQRICGIVEQVGGRVNQELASRDAFPWVPLQYFLPGGAFGVSVDAEGKRLSPRRREDLDRRTAKLALHSLLMMDQLSIASVVASAEPASNAFIFPRLPDRAPYNPSVWKQVAEFYPPEKCDLDLAQLQELVCFWRSKYSHFRNWVIVATSDELKTCAPLPGITLVDVAQAEKLLR